MALSLLGGLQLAGGVKLMMSGKAQVTATKSEKVIALSLLGDLQETGKKAKVIMSYGMYDSLAFKGRWSVLAVSDGHENAQDTSIDQAEGATRPFARNVTKPSLHLYNL
ncbi:hypothetical protein B0H63DRAFT_445946 [Podospora didyma]|uniref:Uncharacterized protein n=1 Tax=Podospora didyma TaxID=330526 RepID=A0AAE0U3R9_9PEZI|nr:hypothetical protein B0H63DRAFT_445946 [Podospora didyma]